MTTALKAPQTRRTIIRSSTVDLTPATRGPLAPARRGPSAPQRSTPEAPSRPARTAPRTLDDAIRAAAARARLETAVTAMADGLAAIEQRCGGRPEALTADDHAEALAAFEHIAHELHAVCGRDSELRPETREALGTEFGRRAQELVHLAGVARRMLVKPRGYAGDAQTIDLMYANAPFGSGVTGLLTDSAVLAATPSRAVRNRRGLLAETIAATVARCDGRPARVMSIACGPAREVSDAAALLGPERLQLELLDLDEQALEATARRLGAEGLAGRFRTHRANALRLRRLDIEPQDLVYSIGLIDYFEDKAVIRLLDQIHDKLAPGGKVVLGNFVDSNPIKELMDHVLEWRLIHRSEEDMQRLFAASRFGRGCTAIRYEAAGINLFAECVKQG